MLSSNFSAIVSEFFLMCYLSVNFVCILQTLLRKTIQISKIYFPIQPFFQMNHHGDHVFVFIIGYYPFSV
jgi:hypothetical protein